jgi:putative Mg2+ transporter-C (MgtC) family protein
MAAGAILGLERELKDKAAGFKTITIICLGSALFAIISYKVGIADHETTRIASYVVSGIGFIGAGVIFKDKIEVSGLTTAGIIWLASAVGMAIGFGEFYLAATFMAASLLVIFSGAFINTVLQPRKQKRDLIQKIEKEKAHFRKNIVDEIRTQGIMLDEKRTELKDNMLIISFEASLLTKKLSWLEGYLISNENIAGFSL